MAGNSLLVPTHKFIGTHPVIDGPSVFCYAMIDGKMCNRHSSDSVHQINNTTNQETDNVG